MGQQQPLQGSGGPPPPGNAGMSQGMQPIVGQPNTGPQGAGGWNPAGNRSGMMQPAANRPIQPNMTSPTSSMTVPSQQQQQQQPQPQQQQGPPPPQQHQQQPPPQGANYVEFDHAIHYVTTIKKRFQHEHRTYQQFLEILHTYQKEQKGIREVLNQVSALFADHPDLLKEFTHFLPEAVQEQAKERLHRAAAEAEARIHAARQQGMDPSQIGPFSQGQQHHQQQGNFPVRQVEVAAPNQVSSATARSRPGDDVQQKLMIDMTKKVGFQSGP